MPKSQKSRKSRKALQDIEHSKSQESRKENGGVRPGLASGLGRIRYSLPLIGAEQRWVLTVGRIEWRRKYCAHRTWWQLVAIPNSHSYVDVVLCSFKTIGKDSVGFGCVVGSTATDSRSDRISLMMQFCEVWMMGLC